MFSFKLENVDEQRGPVHFSSVCFQQIIQHTVNSYLVCSWMWAGVLWGHCSPGRCRTRACLHQTAASDRGRHLKQELPLKLHPNGFKESVLPGSERLSGS